MTDKSNGHAEPTLDSSDPHWSLAGRTPDPGGNREGWMMFPYSGPLQLKQLGVEQVHVLDIAHGLCGINRWNGQSRVAIPVLWHTLMVAELCRGAGAATITEALFHDAAEAYIGDWIQPLKSMMSERMVLLKERVQRTCFYAAGIPEAPPSLSPGVRTADRLMVRYELESDYGYGRGATWHPKVRPDELARANEAARRVGAPPQNADERAASVAAFIRAVREWTPADAPVRRTLPPTDG